MPNQLIPEHIDPFRYADQGMSMEGHLKIAEMARLNANVLPSDEMVHVKMHLGIDEQQITYLKGHLKTQLTLQCQRCMEPFIYEIISDFSLGIVTTLDEVNALPGAYEPALTKDGLLALKELIEDEIILNLPIIPRHEVDECKVKLPLADLDGKEGKGESPFQVLQMLRQQKEK